MSLFGKTLNVAKALLSSDRRALIRNVLESLNTASLSQIESGQDNTAFGAIVKRHMLQFSGYLLLHNQIDEVRRNLDPMMRLNPLTDEEWRLLGEGDRFIRTLNDRFLKTMQPSLGVLGRTCDPYGSLKRVAYEPQTPTAENLLRCCGDSIDELVQEFSHHPSIEKAEALLAKKSIPSLSQEQADMLMASFVQNFKSLRSNPQREDVERLNGVAKGFTSVVSDASRIISHLYAIRCAIELIDVVVFEAFSLERMVALTGDNVYACSGGFDALGQCLDIKAQVSPAGELLLGRGSIAMLVPPKNANFPKAPALVTGYSVQISAEVGATMALKLRVLNEWMNPYPDLVW